MKKVSVQGGAVVTLCDAPGGFGGAWGEDGNIIAALDGLFLSRVPAAGGTPQVLVMPAEKGDVEHRWPQILPGSQAVLFTGTKTPTGFEDASIEVLSLNTGQWKVVQSGGYFGRYMPGGYLVYLHQGTLFGVTFVLDRLEARGTPAPLLEDVAGYARAGAGQFDFSRNGTFVYLSGRSLLAARTIAWLDSSGKTKPLLAAPGQYDSPRFSPDGKRLAFFAGASGIQVYDWERDAMTRLTFAGMTNRYPVWTPDGEHIVFESQDGGKVTLQWIRSDGAGETQALLASKNAMRPYSFSPDGRRLAFRELTVDTGADLWTLPLDTSDPEQPKPGKPELFLRTPFNEYDPAFSPDGKWIAYAVLESGRSEVYVRPFHPGLPSGSGRWLISNSGGQFPIWSRDGRELFYLSADNRIMTVSYTANGDSFTAYKPRLWSNSQLLDVQPAWNFDLAPDGKRFAILPRDDSAGEQNGSVHITFLLNFFDEVRRRIPRN